MVLLKVKSSNINAIGYDGLRKVLVVQFLDGGIYKYENVSNYIYEDFMKIESKGRYFHQNIKGKFSGGKAEGLEIKVEDLQK